MSLSLSFAYFTPRTNVKGFGSEVNGNVTMINGAKLKVEGSLAFNDIDIYPGHKVVSKLKVTAIGENELISYDLVWKGINTLQTQLNFTVYKTTKEYEVTAVCEKKEESLKYLREECSITNIESLGEEITSGTIRASAEEAKTELVEGEYITASKDGNIIYYYVILEYPSLDKIQNYNISGVFAGLVTAEKNNANINIIAYIEQSDGSYKETNDIPTNGSFNEEQSICSNDATVRWENNELIVSNLTKSGTRCYLYFYRDKEIPVIEDLEAKTIGSSITITINASDNVGITRYYYVIDEGKPIEKTTNTHTFEQLTIGQSYEITVYVIDESGNKSEKVTKTVMVSLSGRTLAKLKGTVNEGIPDFSKTATTDEGVFAAQDDDGTTYYYRGAVTNNYLKFANKWWRIIRINGDGTIRIIYDGTEYHANGTQTDDSIAVIRTAFNSSYNDNAYIGFMYGKADQTTYNATHTNTNKSTILQALETWYTSHLLSYASYIDMNAGFCGDRSLSSGTGVGTTETYYGAHLRVGNRAPSLACNENDLYTIKGASGGSKAMTYPIGLITADEVLFAGGTETNDNYYLYNGQNYWTMTPACDNGSYAYVYGVRITGNLPRWGVSNTNGVRPVINLRADVTITGSGTENDPYVVSS